MQPKTKHQTAEKPKKRTKGKTAVKESPASRELEAIKNAWKEEIDTLSSREFESEEEALEALVEVVAARMSLGSKSGSREEGDEELREFLTLLIETDPEIKNSLKFLLK